MHVARCDVGGAHHIMRVTLVNTLSYAAAAATVSDVAFFKEYYLPLGLLTIASVLESGGHLVSIVDPNLIAHRLKTDDSRRLRAVVADEVSASAPDIVGFTTMCDSYHHTLSIAQIIKGSSSVPIILGGPHASATANETLANFPQIDFVVRGEAEGAVLPLLAAISGLIPFSSVSNLSYRNLSAGLQNESAALVNDMDSVPIPAFHLYSNLGGKLTTLPIEAGRGCPFHCDFCSTALFFQRTYRLKSGARILQEMELLENIFGAPLNFRLVHDMLTVNKRQVEHLCDGLTVAERRRIWSCSARIDCVSDRLLRRMVEAGCREIYFGIETGSPRMQRIVKKRLDVSKVQPTVRCAAELGMNCTLSFICGYPDETKQDLADTLSLIMDLVASFGSRVSVQLHVLAPYVGTELYAAQADNLEFDGYLSDQSGQPLDDADKPLIAALPKLFSNYYAIKTKYYERRLLFGIDTFVYVLLRDFPLTLQVLRGMTGDALEVFLAWQQCALKLASPEQIGVVGGERPSLHDGLRNLVGQYRAQNDSMGRLLDGVFRYESAIADELSRSFKLPAEQEQPPQSPDQGITSVIEVPVDIAELRQNLAARRAFSELESGQTQHFGIAIRGPGRVDVHSLSPFLAEVLRLHNEHGCCEHVLRAISSRFGDVPSRDLPAAVQDAYTEAARCGFLRQPGVGGWDQTQ